MISTKWYSGIRDSIILLRFCRTWSMRSMETIGHFIQLRNRSSWLIQWKKIHQMTTNDGSEVHYCLLIQLRHYFLSLSIRAIVSFWWTRSRDPWITMTSGNVNHRTQYLEFFRSDSRDDLEAGDGIAGYNQGTRESKMMMRSTNQLNWQVHIREGLQ